VPEGRPFLISPGGEYHVRLRRGRAGPERLLWAGRCAQYQFVAGTGSRLGSGIAAGAGVCFAVVGA
jgi:hypothetical protein